MLLPAPSPAEVAVRLAVFCALVVAVALVWGGFGALSHDRAGGPRPGRLRRLASGWLALVSVSLLWGALRG